MITFSLATLVYIWKFRKISLISEGVARHFLLLTIVVRKWERSQLETPEFTDTFLLNNSRAEGLEIFSTQYSVFSIQRIWLIIPWKMCIIDLLI